MNIQLSDQFNYKKLLRFTLPTIVMMIFTSIYGVVDGLFVSNFVGKTAFAGVNLIMPFLMALGALGFMIGTGGSALVSKTMGENNYKQANGLFSMLIYLTILLGVIIAVVGIAFLRPISQLLGAEGELVEICVIYGRVYLMALPFFMLQYVFQSFMVTAEKPTLGLVVTLLAGITNIVLDAVFMAVLHWGVTGAALATAIGQTVGGVIPLCYFAITQNSNLRLGKPLFSGKAILRTCTNGSSELMTNLSTSIVNILFNFKLMQFAGENGVSAYGVIMYVNFIFNGVFLGYSIGVAPIVGFNYGANNHNELKNLLKKSLTITGIAAVVMTIVAEVLARSLAMIFVGYDTELLNLTAHAFRVYAFMFLFCGFNIYASSFFTALNNGLVSAVISFARTLVFQILCVIILSAIFKLDGIWFSVVMAEILSLAVTIFCIAKYKNKYHYL